MSVVALPVRPDAIDAAWQRYVALVELQRRDERLLTDRAHQTELVRAHRCFCDLLSAGERSCR